MIRGAMGTTVFRSLLASALSAFVLVGVCQACQCMGGQRPCQQALRAGVVVFVGRVLETIPTNLVGYTMRFGVEEALTDNLGAEVRVQTGFGGGDCGTPLSPGERFLVIANKENGKLWTGACMGNRDLNRDLDAENIIEEYRTALRRESQTIFGTVMLDNTHGVRLEPVKGVVVRAYSGEFAAVAITGANGTYELGGLPIGKYTVVPEVGSELEYDRRPASQYQANLGKGECKEIFFRLRPK